jgi:hypothetical protein
MSNRGRLEDAGIIDRNRNLTGEQYEAIESLSEDEVDQLIAVNDSLKAETDDTDPMIILPGINPTSSSST